VAPNAAGAGVAPNGAGAGVEPKCPAAGVDPNAGAAAGVDPYGAGAGVEPNAGAAALAGVDPNVGAGVAPPNEKDGVCAAGTGAQDVPAAGCAGVEFPKAGAAGALPGVLPKVGADDACAGVLPNMGAGAFALFASPPNVRLGVDELSDVELAPNWKGAAGAPPVAGAGVEPKEKLAVGAFEVSPMFPFEAGVEPKVGAAGVLPPNEKDGAGASVGVAPNGIFGCGSALSSPRPRFSLLLGMLPNAIGALSVLLEEEALGAGVEFPNEKEGAGVAAGSEDAGAGAPPKLNAGLLPFSAGLDPPNEKAGLASATSPASVSPSSFRRRFGWDSDTVSGLASGVVLAEAGAAPKEKDGLGAVSAFVSVEVEVLEKLNGLVSVVAVESVAAGVALLPPKEKPVDFFSSVSIPKAFVADSSVDAVLAPNVKPPPAALVAAAAGAAPNENPPVVVALPPESEAAGAGAPPKLNPPPPLDAAAAAGAGAGPAPNVKTLDVFVSLDDAVLPNENPPEPMAAAGAGAALEEEPGDDALAPGRCSSQDRHFCLALSGFDERHALHFHILSNCLKTFPHPRIFPHWAHSLTIESLT
jgi:hypothetical protein